METITNEEEEVVCAICMGTGEVSFQEQVYPGEPHYTTATRKCLCTLPDPDDYQEEDR